MSDGIVSMRKFRRFFLSIYLSGTRERATDFYESSNFNRFSTIEERP